MTNSQVKQIGTDDFVAHRDILSSPVKGRSVSPNKQLLLNPPKSRHVSPSKKNILETLHTSPPSSPLLNLTPALNAASSGNTSPIKLEVPMRRKRGRPTKEETLARLKAEGINPTPKPIPIISLPNGKKRKGRPRKEEVLARLKLKQEEDAKNLKLALNQLPEVEEETTKIIKGDLLTENILPSRLPRRSALQLKRKLDFDDSSSDDDTIASDTDSSKEFNPDADKDSEEEDVVDEDVIDENDLVVKRDKNKTKEDKPKKKRGRPRKLISDVPNLEPSTPRKSKEKSTSRDFNFVSPLKKTILDNLERYKTNGQSTSLRLDKDFVPAPFPNANYKPRQTVTKANDFLDTYEGFFDQRKPHKSKRKSTNTMAMAPEITREEFALISNTFNKFFLKRKRDKLYELHYKMFPQYWFELTQGFTLVFYGIGSKRKFLEKFTVDYLSPKLKQIQLYLDDDQMHLPSGTKNEYIGVPCIVVNGYNPTCSYRDVFKDISKLLFPEQLSSNETKYWGNHVSLQVAKMIEFYETQPHDIKLILVIHNIDGPSVRKDAFQTMLSSLAVIKQISIVASADHIYAPVLWDNKKSQNYNFIFHDVTNYEPYSVESSFQDVMKMGKKENTIGAEGAKYVLESLTINSKKLFKVLVETQITKMESNGNGKPVPAMKRSSLHSGLEFKQLAQRCAQEFIASNDISLRTMLREFIEHNMTNISKTSGGTEYVWIPYNYSELNKLKDTALANIE